MLVKSLDMHRRQRQATPPDVIVNGEPPYGVDGGQLDDLIVLFFPLACVVGQSV
jgi:hypothetical protein